MYEACRPYNPCPKGGQASTLLSLRMMLQHLGLVMLGIPARGPCFSYLKANDVEDVGLNHGWGPFKFITNNSPAETHEAAAVLKPSNKDQ